jgi:hypothetical protein
VWRDCEHATASVQRHKSAFRCLPPGPALCSGDGGRQDDGRRYIVELTRRLSIVPGGFLRELYAGGESEFGIDMGEVGLHSTW